MTTFSELQTQIRSYTETDSNVLTDTIVNDFILQAELRIFREVDLDCFRSYQFTTLSVGNEFIVLPTTPFTLITGKLGTILSSDPKSMFTEFEKGEIPKFITFEVKREKFEFSLYSNNDFNLLFSTIKCSNFEFSKLMLIICSFSSLFFSLR